MSKAKPKFLFRIIDRGLVESVPMVDCYLIQRTGPAEAGLLCGRNLSPKTADELAKWFAANGVKTERQKQPAPVTETQTPCKEASWPHPP